MNTQLSAFNSEKFALNKKKQELQDKLDLAQKDVKRLTSDLAKARDNTDDIKNELNLYRNNELVTNKHIEEKTATVQKVFDEFPNVKNQLLNVNEKSTQLDDEISSLQDQIKELSNENPLLHKQNAEDANIKQPLVNDISNLNNKIKTLETALNSKQMNAQFTDNKITLLTNDNAVMKNLITKLKSTITDLIRSI